jgi:hypothetical protein
MEDPDVISLSQDPDVIQIKNTRYRKFRLDLPGYNRQDLIYHYLFDLKESNKVYVHSKGWFYEIKPHLCNLDCKDSKKK